MTVTPSVTIPRGSEEQLHARVTGPVVLTMPVELSLTGPEEVNTWIPAEWIGDVGTSRECRTVANVVLSEANYPARVYSLYARAAGAEQPIVFCGYVYLV